MWNALAYLPKETFKRVYQDALQAAITLKEYVGNLNQTPPEENNQKNNQKNN
ncbi:hypothetical protein JP0474_01730 [Helicobacter pylori]|nr:hypothetical protein HPOKI128_01810 [Helicobacter pylori oki128]AHN39795.1 hypothetical protein HPOKI154_01825 [Helicobacter pylori oki154]AHN42695.1 hypothetical protein HPOKI673_01815 [Helicobacter pylori oki673]AHN44139.1 hypothetical protein HPOKI828_01810 [Helicobacter pylori oki828]GHS60521.1 hypothetical protein JP0521_01090 [Helicobacter pylori]